MLLLICLAIAAISASATANSSAGQKYSVTASAPCIPNSGFSNRMNVSSAASMTRDQCIDVPGGSNRYWNRSNQPCPPIKSRTSTSRMASSVDMASKMLPLIAGNASVTDAAKNSNEIKIFGYAPPCSFRGAWPEVKLRSDMVSESLVIAVAPGSDLVTTLAPSDERHLARHNRHEQRVGGERQARHVAHRIADGLGVHARLRHLAAVRLQHAVDHAVGHRRCGVADIDLPDRDVVAAAVEVGGLGQAGDGVFGGSIGRGERPRRMRGDRAVVDDAT